jgi:cytochrome c2
VVKGETVVEVVVEFDPGVSGVGVTFPGLDSSVPGAAPPRPRTTAFPPVAVGAGPGDARKGEQLFASKGCSGCHSTGTKTVVGPGLAGVADRAGAEVYLWESIRNPAAFIVPGFPNAMPPFGTLTDQEVNDLIEYLKTLK